MGRYRAGEVIVESELAMSLPAATEAGDAAFVIARGNSPRGVCDSMIVESPGVAVARFERGSTARRIWVEPSAGVSDAELRWFVRGLVVPTALQRRGAFFVHAGSVIIDGALVGFVGESGVGKSLLAAQVARSGHRFFGDDSLVLTSDAPVRGLLGSSPLRLTDEAARELGVDPERYPSCTVSGKRLVEPDEVGAVSHQSTAPLGALYFASRGAVLRIAACSGPDAVAELLAAEFHPNPGVREVSEERRRFEAAVSIAGAVPTRRLQYPTSLDTIPRVVDALVRDVRELRQR